MTIIDIYKNLFGRSNIQDGNVIEMAEHGRVGGVSTGQGVKYVQILDSAGSVVSNSAASTTVTQVASSASSVTLQAANTNRKMLTVFNDSTAVLYVKLGATASTSSYSYKLASGDTLELPYPIYTGVVDGIWASVNGNALVTEY